MEYIPQNDYLSIPYMPPSGIKVLIYMNHHFVYVTIQWETSLPDITLPRGRNYHDDVFKWKHFPCYWPFVRGIHRWPVNSPHKGQWRRALMFSLICALNKTWVNHREASDLRRHRAHYDVIVMYQVKFAQLVTPVGSKWLVLKSK